MNRIYVIFGKSASGKDSLYQALLNDADLKLKSVIPYTTRPMRSGETEGREYHFVSNEAFEQMKEEGRVVESRSYHTVHGIWNYFTADDGQIVAGKENYLLIGTLESYVSLKKYFGKEYVSPIYVEVDDGERLMRAVLREKEQEEPKYAEMCRRYLADCEDFSKQRLMEAEIEASYVNEKFEDCFQKIKGDILNRMC